MSESRRRILERRAAFVAAAVAAVATASCERNPLVCLSAVPLDEGPKPTPPPDAAAPPVVDAAPEIGATAVPCLSIAMPPRDAGPPDAKPHPCLKMLPPDSGF